MPPRPVPSGHSATDRMVRWLLNQVPETLTLCHPDRGAQIYHGHECRQCVRWPECRREMGERAGAADYCSKPKRGGFAFADIPTRRPAKGPA